MRQLTNVSRGLRKRAWTPRHLASQSGDFFAANAAAHFAAVAPPPVLAYAAAAAILATAALPPVLAYAAATALLAPVAPPTTCQNLPEPPGTSAEWDSPWWSAVIPSASAHLA